MPLVWAAYKDLICPLFNIEVCNVRLVTGEASAIDVSKYFEDVQETPSDEPFIFVNESARSPVLKNAFVLLAAAEAHGLRTRDVFEKLLMSPLASQFVGLCKLAFVDDNDADEFIALIMKCLDMASDDFPHVRLSSSNKVKKESQMGSTSSPQWWLLGLPEKMLEPVRGSDWSTYEKLQPMQEAFWDEVKLIESKKKQGEGLPMDLLLRLKDGEEDKTDATITIQNLLSKQRIWN